MQENLCEVVAATTDNALLKPTADKKDDVPAKVVAVAGASGNEPAAPAVAVPVNDIHMTSVVSMLAMTKPFRYWLAVKAFWAVPPRVIDPEQSCGVTSDERLFAANAVDTQSNENRSTESIRFITLTPC